MYDKNEDKEILPGEKKNYYSKLYARNIGVYNFEQIF